MFKNLLFLILVSISIYITITFIFPYFEKFLPKQHNMSLEGMANKNAEQTKCQKCWGENYSRTNADNKKECECEIPWDNDADMYSVRREKFGCDPKIYPVSLDGTGCSKAPPVQQPVEEANAKNIKKTEDAKKNLFCPAEPNCPQGCSKPTQITGKCPSTIFKESDGTCYKKCPYVCSNMEDNCKYDKCCLGCGFKKFKINCDGTMIPDTKKTGQELYDDNQSPYAGQPPDSTNQENLVQRNMGDFNGAVSPPGTIKAFNTGAKGNYAVRYTCRPTTTGMFTDCGPVSANIPCYQNFS